MNFSRNQVNFVEINSWWQGLGRNHNSRGNTGLLTIFLKGVIGQDPMKKAVFQDFNLQDKF